MGLQNVAICNTNGAGNTGFGACVVDIGYIGMLIFAPDGFKIPTTSIAAALTTINAGILNNNPLQRLYPVSGLVQPTDSSESPTIQTFNDGSKAVVKEGFYDWTFQFTKGAFCLSFRLRMANGLNRSFFIVDKNGRLYGTDTGDGMVTAIKPALAWTHPFKLNDGTKVTEYATMVNFDPAYLNDYPSFLDFKNNGGYGALLALTGLQDVLLAKISRLVAVLKVSAKTACGTVNLYDVYGATLANTAAWLAYADSSGVPGNALTITSVAGDANVKGYTITIDTADPDYTAGAPIWVSLAGPTQTQPILLAGYESNVVSVAL
jgi:hypothetical protein